MELNNLTFKQKHIKPKICMCMFRGGGSVVVMERVRARERERGGEGLQTVKLSNSTLSRETF